MSEHRNNALRAAIDDCLSGVTERPSLQGKVLNRLESKAKTQKKVSFAVVLAAVLLLAAVTALAAAALSGWLFAGQREIGTPNSSAVLNGRLYYLSYQGLCAWSPGGERSVVLSREALDAAQLSPEAELFCDGQGLLALDLETGKLWRLEKEGPSFLTYPAKGKLAQKGVRFDHPVMQNGYLWLRAVEDGQAEEEAALYRVDLESGELRACWVKGVVELAAYGGDKLAALVRDVEERQDRLLVLSASSGNIRETLFTAPILTMQGLAVDEQSNTLYATVSGWLSCWNGEGWTQLAPFTPRAGDAFYGVAEDGYVAVGPDGIQYQLLREEGDALILTIRGMQDTNDTDFTYQRLHPGVRIARQSEASLTAREVRELIQSGDTTDLFHFRLDADARALFEDGLAAPLSEEFETDCAAMLPAVSDALHASGALYAAPSMLLIPGFDLRGQSAAPKPPVQGWLFVYLVNPNGQHGEEALTYLSHMAKNRAPQDEALLKPQEAEPMLYPAMQEWLLDIEADQRALDAELGVPTDEAALEARLEEVKNLPNMWEVTQAGLETYRENVAPYLVLVEEKK